MKKLGFIGMGNMAGAIAQGIVKSGFLKGEDIIAYDIVSSQLDKVKDLGFVIAKDEKEVVCESEMVFIGVKPQVVEKVLEPLIDLLKKQSINFNCFRI